MSLLVRLGRKPGYRSGLGQTHEPPAKKTYGSAQACRGPARRRGDCPSLDAWGRPRFAVWSWPGGLAIKMPASFFARVGHMSIQSLGRFGAALFVAALVAGCSSTSSPGKSESQTSGGSGGSASRVSAECKANRSKCLYKGHTSPAARLRRSRGQAAEPGRGRAPAARFRPLGAPRARQKARCLRRRAFVFSFRLCFSSCAGRLPGVFHLFRVGTRRHPPWSQCRRWTGGRSRQCMHQHSDLSWAAERDVSRSGTGLPLRRPRSHPPIVYTILT